MKFFNAETESLETGYNLNIFLYSHNTNNYSSIPIYRDRGT